MKYLVFVLAWVTSDLAVAPTESSFFLNDLHQSSAAEAS